MEQPITYTGAAGVVLATDGTGYASLALLQAAGKTAFPGLEAQGLYPSSLVVTCLNAGEAAAGDGVSIRTNEDSLPAAGVPVQGAGQQFVIPGTTPNRYLISNVWIVGKVTGSDHIKISALYD